MSQAKATVFIVDGGMRPRGYLVPMGGDWFHVYTMNGQYHGAGTSLASSIEMAREKAGIVYEEMPAVNRSEIRTVKGERIKIVGFQGGGWYRIDQVYMGDRLIGRIQIKNQPARRRFESLTLMEGENSCVLGADVDWLVRRAGYRLVG